MNKLRALMSDGSQDRATVRRALEQCARHGRKLTIESISRESESEPKVASIAQVREHDFIIDRPMVGAHVRPLTVNEPVRISFVTDTGYCSGLTKPLSRYKFSSGGKGAQRVLYGYRLAIPDELHTANRRRHFRLAVETSTPLKVMLHVPDVSEPITAMVLDVSAGGMRLRLEQDALLLDGQEVLLTAEFPQPCGAIAEPVNVVRITQCPRTNRPIAAVSFPDEVIGLARYVRELEIQRASRAGGQRRRKR